MARKLICIGALAAMFATGTPAEAAPILTTEYRSIANGDHYHSNYGQGADVGSWGSEVVRAVAEFDLSGESAGTSRILSFEHVGYGSPIFGGSGPGDYDVEVLAFLGNGTVDFGDYSAATFQSIGTFNTAGLSPGDVLSFDVTSAFDAALGSGGFLGFRLQHITAPGGTISNQFADFQITDTSPVPEPASIVMLLTGGLGLAGGAIRRRRAKKSLSV